MTSRLTTEIVYYSHINPDLREILGKMSTLLKINRLTTRIALMIIISDNYLSASLHKPSEVNQRGANKRLTGIYSLVK